MLKAIEREKNGNAVQIVNMSRGRAPDYLTYFLLKGGSDNSNVQFIPTAYMDNKKLAVLWDSINIYPQLRQEVFNALQLIDNEIQEVVLVGREKNITPILIYRNSDERIPLKSLGDGIIHLFYIILGLVNARGGVILIDEFENGLHYTAHEKVWNLVFELSEKLNVQVFATTHSYDCIKAFQEAAQNHQTEGMLFHLGRSALKSDQGKIIATAYDKEELRLADLAKLEVR